MSATETSLRDLLRGVGSGAVVLPLEETDGAKPKAKAGRRTTLKRQAGHKDLLDALFDRITPFYLADASGNLVISSRAFTEMAPALFSTDREPASLDETPAALMSIIQRLHAEEGEVKRSDSVSIAGQEKHFISTHFSVRGEKDRILGFGGIYEDVTPLARATQKAGEMESWLQDVIRSSSDWLWAVDHNFNLTFVSPRISEAIGTPAQALSGRHFFTLGRFEDAGTDGGTERQMKSQRPFRNHTFVMDGADGESRYVLVSGVPIFDEKSGRFQGYRGTGTDVTRRFKAERSAIDAKAQLEKTLDELRQRNRDLVVALEKSEVADKAKIDFLAMMSHELRTPLNCIIGFSDAAAQKVHGQLNESYVEYFDNIHKAGTHLLDIINDILDTANIEARNIAIEPIPVKVSELVHEAASMVDPKVGDRGRIVATDGKIVDTDLFVLADRLRARQILVNLLSNAIKFTPEDGEIGVDISTGPDNLINMTVWDTGVGIAPEEQDRVFDPFYQVEKNILSRGTEGTGLGLAISRQLAQLMMGDLTVESEVGKGTRFTLSLPRAKVST
ncbi:MAG: ATP-binding protein [Alphaproteobacteria bacterium]|nr:ATP-binding protein [Alphaproteobacteria bacterium]